jgi:hypothetical protein
MALNVGTTAVQLPGVKPGVQQDLVNIGSETIYYSQLPSVSGSSTSLAAGATVTVTGNYYVVCPTGHGQLDVLVHDPEADEPVSPVLSVFGRSGAVVKQAGDYGVADVTGAAPLSVASTQQAGDYTFVLGDAGTVVEGTKATAQTFTIPTHASVAFPVGTIIEVFQDGAGQITIAGAGGVTLRSDGAKVKTAAQYATIGLRQRAADEWVLSGDLA